MSNAPRPSSMEDVGLPAQSAAGVSSDWSAGNSGTATSAVRVPKLSHVVAERLRSQIVTGKLQSGMTLPAETELIAMFKVSRPTVREALRILETEGLVVLARGSRSGAEVRMPSVDRAAHYVAMVLSSSGATMADIHQARMALEPALTRPLASPERREAVAMLRQCVEQQQAALLANDYRSALTSIHRFHELLWHSAGNSVLTLLVGMLQYLSQSTFAFLIERGASNPGELHKNMSKTVVGHRRLLDLLEAGRADEAEAFWSRYMIRAHQFLSRSSLGASRLTYESVDSSR